MMFTPNDCFIDSSILIEYNKGTKTKLVSILTENEQNKCLLNETVLSEFLFHFLAKTGAKAPLTLKSGNAIMNVFAASNQYKLISFFTFLPNTKELFSLVPILMSKYNLLPNDAIILATCKLNGISQLASHYADFIIPCKLEGITLLIEN